MVSTWNRMVPAATAAGLDVKTRKAFTDRPTAIKQLQKLSRALDRAAPAASAVPPTAAVAAPESEPVPTAKAKPMRGYAPDAYTELLAASNPKKSGTKAHAAFAHYRTGMLVADFIRAVGSEREATGHLKWDAKHGFIRIA
jgi:hypothetical protein